MPVQFCLALLGLFTLTAASDPDCEDLVKTEVDPTKICGKWIFHTGTSDNGIARNALRAIHSSWLDIAPIPGSNEMTMRYGDKIDGKCFQGAVNFIFSTNLTKVTFSFNASTHDHIGRHLVTCPDCLLWTDQSVSVENGQTKERRNLYLFTKSGTLDASHQDKFKKQAKCLNFPEELHFGTNTDLCPDEKEADTDATKKEQ
ncbi:uncharacterized protein [Brachyistius frenatus]|uniref:uncharacterized protein n=1 Tax=Brachyistius frenatus TaxID=100188 RepID=UPI0037E86BFB